MFGVRRHEGNRPATGAGRIAPSTWDHERRGAIRNPFRARAVRRPRVDLRPWPTAAFLAAAALPGAAPSGAPARPPDSDREGAHFEIDERTANALSRDAAFVVREGDYTVDRADGTSPTIHLVMTTMWHRDDDGWKMVHLHESVPPPDVEGSGGDE